MSKRCADSQRDGNTGDFEVMESQMEGSQKATAAQLASRNIRTARSRQGRRPVSQQRPTGFFGSTPAQDPNTLQSTMATQNATNGAQPPQGAFGFSQQSNGLAQSFDQPASTNPSPFSTSASFPPFGSGHSNDFNPQFPPKSSSFEFDIAKSTSFNNPFSSANGNISSTYVPNAAGQSGGFQGSIFKIPPTAPFSSGNAIVSKPADQNLFNWGSSASSASSPKPQSQLLGDVFEPSKDDSVPSPSSNPFGEIFLQQQSTNGLVGQNSAPAATPNPASSFPDIFGQKSLHQGQNQSPRHMPSFFGQPNSQQSSSSASIFESNSTPSKQPQQSSIFAPPDEDSMSTSPDNSPQAKDPASRPFAFLNAEKEPNNNGNDKEHTQEGSLFSKISQPAVIAPAANTSEGNSPQPNLPDQPSDNSSAFAISTKNASAGFPSTPMTAGQTSPTRSNGFRSTQTYSISTSEDTNSATDSLFGNLKLPGNSPSSQIGATSNPSALLSPNNLQTHNAFEFEENGKGDISSVEAQSNFEKIEQASIFDHPAWGTPPSAPADFNDVQRQQLIIGYQLKCLDAGLQHHVFADTKFHGELEPINIFYSQLKQAILNGEGISREMLARGKRKSVFDGYENKVHSKKTRFDNEEANNGSLIATSATTQPLLTEPASLPQVLNTKRKGDGEVARTNFKGSNDGSKRIQGDLVSYPSILPSSSSQTSNIFKNILDRKDPESSQDTPEPEPVDTSKGNPSLQPSSTGWSTSETMNTLNSDDQTRPVHSTITSETLQQNALTFPLNNYPTATLSSSASKAILAPFQAQSETSATNQNPFSSKPKSSNNLSSSPPKTSSLAPPKFDLAPINFLSQFGKVAEDNAKKEKQSRKAKDFDSDEDDEAEWERKDAEEQLAKKQKLNDALKGKTAQFIPGKGFALSNDDAGKKESGNTGVFGSPPRASVQSASQGSSTSVLSRPSQGLVNGHNIFSHLSDVESGPEGSKTGDADDEDTGSEGGSENEGRDLRKGETNRDKNDEKPKSLANSNPFGPSPLISSNQDVKAVTEAAYQTQSVGRSLFERISKDTDVSSMREVPPLTEKESLFKSTSSQPPKNIFEQITPGFGTKSFGGPSIAMPKGNMFDQPPSASSSDNKNPVPSSAPKPSAFEQSPAGSPTPIFGSGSSPGGDNTWKADSPIKFGTSSSLSGIKIGSPTPSKPSLGGLFGSPPVNQLTENTPKPPTASIFSITPAKAPTDVGFGFNFGGPPKTTLGTLAPPSNVASAATSRATSPGVTTGGESANESNADEDVEKHEQLDLAARGPGEEDEDVLFTAKAKAMSYDASTKSWPSQGVGMLRVLKHRESAKTRILMRQDPSGKVILNAALLGTLNYEYSKPKAVRMAIATDAGKLSTWMIRVGKDEEAMELARTLEANKSN